MNIEFAYPPTYILICIVAGIAAAVLLYYGKRNQKLFPQKIRYVLSALRFLSVFFIALLLLSPLVKTQKRYSEKPILIVANDNSESIRLSRDSVFNVDLYPSLLNEQLAELSQDFEVVKLNFGSSIQMSDTPDFTDKTTNIQNLINEVIARYGKRNIGALIISSDGIYNKGKHPIFAAQEFGSPIISIGLGDTTEVVDAAISNLSSNSISFLGNNLPVEIDIKSYGLSGKQTTLRILRKGKVLASKNVNFNTTDYFSTYTFQVPADEVGILKFTVELTPLKEEFTFQNNYAEFYVEVIDSRRKIAVVGDAPHPDLGAMKQAIEKNKNYEVEIWLSEQEVKDLKDKNLVILHNVPGRSRKFSDLPEKLKALKVPTLYILGQNSSIVDFNRLNIGVTISNYRNTFDAVYPALNPSFTAFSNDDETEKLLKLGIPLVSPFGNYVTDSRAEIYLYRKIGNVSTNFPLIAFLNEGTHRNALISGEGLWRQRIESFKNSASHTPFDQWFGKIIQFVTVAEDKNRFKVKYPKLISEEEEVLIYAEFYNKSFELTNIPEAQISIKNDSGNVFKYTFSRIGDSYLVNLGMLNPGEYSFDAELNFAGEKFSKKGNFSVQSINKEGANLVADFNLLRQLSNATNGVFITGKEVDQLLEIVQSLETTQTIIFNKQEFSDLINHKIIFFILLMILGIEWLVRKYLGNI